MLPALVEYLASQEITVGRGRLCHPGISSVQFTMIPTSIARITAEPGPSYYAGIHYATSIACLPDRINLSISNSGEVYFEGLITEEEMRGEMGHIILFTRAQPIDFSVSNLSALNQVVNLTIDLLLITNEDDLKLVRQHIKAYNAIEKNFLFLQQLKVLEEIRDKIR